MPLTISDVIISIVITALLLALIKWIYKRTDRHATPMGCLIGVLILFYFVLSTVRGCSAREQAKAESNLTKVKLVSNGEIIKIPNTDFHERDTMYIAKKHVYKNNTGRVLVQYMVRYSKNGAEKEKKISGTVINPEQYFYWYGDDDKDYRMFETPPASTTIVTYSRYGRGHQRDFTYLHFLDYEDNIPDYVNVIK